MASIDLNIIQRGAASDFKWTAGPGKITAADLGNIGEQRTDNGGALNALPTPFARFFIFKEAFRRVLEERNDSKKAAGRAYEQLVSNCLDVFELLYNKKYHENLWKNSGRHIVVKEWNYDNDLKTLKDQVPILGRAIESYFNDDLGEKKIFFVILVQDGKEYLLATSSPLTGFITPPDMDLKCVKDDVRGGSAKKFVFVGDSYNALEATPLKRKTIGNYFHDIQLFDKRPADFKNYMYSFLFGNGGSVDDKFRELRDYIQSFKNDPDIKTNWEAGRLSSIFSNENSEVVVNGISMKTGDDLDSVNYFADAILKVPYKLCSDNFKTLTYINDKPSRDYDYLLPLSDQALDVLDTDNFKAECQEKNQAIEVKIVHRGKEFKKTFRMEDSALKAGEGRIVQMGKAKINLDMAVFPNVLSSNDVENNYFKVLVSTFDDNDRRSFTIDKIHLDFYRKGSEGRYKHIEEATDSTFKSGIRPSVIRSQQNTGVECGTKYYEVFNSSFDAILLTANIDFQDYTFAVFPKWSKAKPSNKVFDYAIDLGTSNTYISRREKGTMNEPQQLAMDSLIVSYLHERAGSEQKNQVICWEDNTPLQFKTAYKTEFVPPFIDGDVYKFPIRTALCRTGDDSSKISLFDNSNIAFFYEKSKPAGNQHIVTDIKWSADEKALRVFIRELLLIIKADMLQENATISKTGLIWFRPLSFKETERNTFENIWSEEAKSILNIESLEEQIKCYTESEAPYYYFNVKDEYRSVESVAIVDIGGGSTDFVYFEKGEPKVANSVHFGCDVLWGNAFDKFRNSKKNGIYKRYKDTIGFESASLKEVNQLMLNDPESTTQDIINFWISNNAETHISDKLKEDFSFIFAYHYTAIVYYLASMLKANGYKHPRTITFSGNGSRYIDQYITSNIEILTDITHLIMSKVYNEEIADIQLILPIIRKECTCYGGLYHKDGVAQPRPIIYYGDGRNDMYKDVEALSLEFHSIVKPAVFAEVETMNSIYAEVLGALIRRGVVNNKLDIENILKLINKGVDDILESKFQTEIIEKYSKIEQYNDTLFFMPVNNALLDLTNYKN